MLTAEYGGSKKTVDTFLTSIKQIPLERQSLDFKNGTGRRFTQFWDEGAQVYKEDSEKHRLVILSTD